MFGPVHEAGAKTRDLKSLSDGTEGYFGESLWVERAVGDAPDDASIVTDNAHTSASIYIGKNVNYFLFLLSLKKDINHVWL